MIGFEGTDPIPGEVTVRVETEGGVPELTATVRVLLQKRRTSSAVCWPSDATRANAEAPLRQSGCSLRQ